MAISSRRDTKAIRSIPVTLIWAFLFTGLGQVYLGKRLRGLFYLSVHLLGAGAIIGYVFHPRIRVSSLVLIPLVILVLFEIYVIAEAYLSACKMRGSGADAGRRRLRDGIAWLLLPVVMFAVNGHILLAALLASWVVVAPPEPSTSMIPTIRPGDVFLVNKRAYYYVPPMPGDILVFDDPQGSGRAFVKRLIAGAENHVAIQDGQVQVNGGRHWNPLIAGRSYVNAGRYGGAGHEVDVLPGHYYVLGDNSPQSRDSRYWGLLEDDLVIGQAYKIIYPFERSGALQ